MKSNDQTIIEVTAQGQKPLRRTVRECYALISGSKGSDAADLWLAKLASEGEAKTTAPSGQTVTFRALTKITYCERNDEVYKYGAKEVDSSGGEYTQWYSTEKTRDFYTDMLWGEGAAADIKAHGRADR